MLSIITVNWRSYDFLQLLIESAHIYTSVPYDMIVIDNSTEKQKVPQHDHIHVFPQNTNIGHGAGLNKGVEIANEKFDHPYIMFIDVDSHFLCHDWHVPFTNLLEDYWVIGGQGVEAKPIRPSCMLITREIAGDYDYRDTPGYKGHRVTPEGSDVAIQAYYQMRKDDIPIKLIDAAPNRYGTLNGEEWEINGKSLVYHHWSGTYLKERQADFPNNDLFYDKELLFSKIPWRVP